jgi:hypothetical protein
MPYGFLAPKEFDIIWFLYACLETGRIMWLGMAAGGRPHLLPKNLILFGFYMPIRLEVA